MATRRGQREPSKAAYASAGFVRRYASDVPTRRRVISLAVKRDAHGVERRLLLRYPRRSSAMSKRAPPSDFPTGRLVVYRFGN